jgi:hypothetical protein
VIINKGGVMKKFTALFLIFSFMMMSCTTVTSPTMEKRFPGKKGAKLIITKKDGQLIEGELITVKPNSFLLLNTDGKDVSVDIEDIRVILIVKKSRFLQSLGMGVLIGAGAGAIIGFALGETPGFVGGTVTAGENALFGAALLGFWGLFFGGIAGLSSGKDETIQIEGKSDKKIKKALDSLRRKARIRDYR